MRASDYRFFDARFAAFAHRGGSLYGPNIGRENTIFAFQQAWSMGFRYFETDVRATSDGVAVAFHDETLDRVTDGRGPIAESPHAALAAVRIGGADPIPTVDELLETFPQARINLDIKAPNAVEPLARTIRAHRAQSRVCVGSFSHARLNAFRRIMGSTVPVSAPPFHVAIYAYGYGLRELGPIPGVALQIPREVWYNRVAVLKPDLVRAAHRTGRAVHVWTIDDEAEMHELIDAGVDGIFSDRIDVLKRVLIERGLWEDRP